MNWKKLVANSASLIYLILISLFFFFFKTDFICRFEKPCLRFCSSDTEKYSNVLLFDEFIDSNVTYWFQNNYNLTNIFRGPPYCNGEMKLLETVKNKYNDEDEEEDVDDEDNGMLSIYENGHLYKNGEAYTINTYCLKRDEDASHKFVAMICVKDKLTVNQSALVAISVISIIILTSTLSVYLYYPELRDFYGKMIIYFLISMICSSVTPLRVFDDKNFMFKIINFVMAFGFTSGNLWLNSMVLNVYFRCRDFRSSKSKDGNFSSYASYVGVFTTFVLMFILWEMTILRHSSAIKFIALVHSFLIFNDFVVLIITSFIIKNISKQIGFSERAEFEKEKKIFWIYVKLFAIMSLTWSTQIYAFENEEIRFDCLTVAFIMLFSTLNVAGLFMGRKKVIDLVTRNN
ncbi:unnamed protein product [Chironomus riparius]|uniref:Uncharacterized protein n=1 Tax=Chironomus riparius TaxID=315576 RepID=A0A9N9RXE2_9DIPT|nr:unnamed protein product [Chironomus riparius]